MFSEAIHGLSKYGKPIIILSGHKFYKKQVSDAIFTMSPKGKPNIILSGYKFCIKDSKGIKTYWRCSKHKKPNIVVSGYKFSIKEKKGFKTYWQCSSHKKRGCLALLHTLDDNTIIKCLAKFIKSSGSQPIIMVYGYRFNKHQKIGLKTYWQCSKHKQAIFKKSSRGQRVIFLSGYRFCKNKVMGKKTYWQCATHKHRGCHAVFTISLRGQPIILMSGYRFCKHQVMGPKTHWHCSTHKKLGCRAKIHTFNDNNRTIIMNSYNGNMYLEIFFLGAVFTMSLRGKPIIRILGYRFRKYQLRGHKTHWRCSTHQPQGCRAVIHTIQDNCRTRITKCHNVHNH
ncbi:Uncharacterized protein OBRU01_07788 [Operophtera brumata]|uniref:FLYWCH-type domain-containing protein n=1 Tax=Operophtera brumata TaxID=104452 RepID=A0A0L7L9P2_OPEBR|nr:Uncharacterized protein OBRU01_07788 [Operophtera brumata]